MKYSLKFNDLNLYLCSIVIGLLQYMLHSKNYDIGIWSLGMPMFRDDLKIKDVDPRLLKIIDLFDEFGAMKTLNLDVDNVLKEKIDIVLGIMNETNNQHVKEIVLEKTEQKHWEWLEKAPLVPRSAFPSPSC